MSYRKQLQAAAMENPRRIQAMWREERAFRIGKVLSFAGILLSAVATVADWVWSAPSVLGTDILLLAGCGLSLYWIRKPKRSSYFWWPLYWTLWISMLPSLWTTGGLNSPFFAVGLALLYVLAAVLDTKNHSLVYLIFVILHIPVFYLVELWVPLSQVAPPPLELTGFVSGVTLAALVICVHALLNTEKELSLEFAEHYRNFYRTEEELKQAQSIARLGSWEWDVGADRISWSDELFKIFGVAKENFDPSFQAYLNRLNPELRERVHTMIKKSLETGEDFIFENRVSSPKGDKFIFSRGRVIQDDRGQAVRMLGTSQDITDRKEIESQLLAARGDLEKRVEERTLQLEQSLEREKDATRAAESANQAKMQFLANMSHEIRTPMNAILGFSELLRADQFASQSAQDYLARIRANGNQLLHLIDDILDLSKFEAGQIPIQKSVFSLRDLMSEVLGTFTLSLKSKGLDLEISYPENVPSNISSDLHRIRQILANLIGNAIKFSEKGKIHVQVMAGPEISKTFIIDIRDHGIGITEENQKKLFQPFSQGDSSIVRKFGGSGLGLALSKRIAEALDGSLELKSSIFGQGSHFRLQIPVGVVDGSNIKSTSEAQELSLRDLDFKIFKNKRILLAEDSPDNVTLIAHYIHPYGIRMDVATDGERAVHMSRHNKYDCILMDIQMPGLDGLEATRRIRAQGYTKPIIALTAHALPFEMQRSLDAGCDLHLTKPIHREELLITLGARLKDSDGPG